MTTDRQRCPWAPPEVMNLKKVTRFAMLFALLAAGLFTTACQGGNLYNGVDFNGGFDGPSTRSVGGITGYPF